MKRLNFVDLDGVLCDFIGGVEREFQLEPGHLKSRKEYDLHKILNLSYGAFSNRLRVATEINKFWLGLHPLPWAHDLVDLFNFGQPGQPQGDADSFILTSPWPGDYQCQAQKVEWCSRNFGIGSDRVICFPHKHVLSAPGRMLIDDHPNHCLEWASAGGDCFVFPCTHNGRWHPIMWEQPDLLVSTVKTFLNESKL